MITKFFILFLRFILMSLNLIKILLSKFTLYYFSDNFVQVKCFVFFWLTSYWDHFQVLWWCYTLGTFINKKKIRFLSICTLSIKALLKWETIIFFKEYNCKHLAENFSLVFYRTKLSERRKYSYIYVPTWRKFWSVQIYHLGNF